MTERELRETARVLEARGLSERRSCALAGIARSHYHDAADNREDPRLVKELQEIAYKHKRYEYRRAWALLRRAGWRVNRKRVRRLWRKLGLSLPRRSRKRRKKGGFVPLRALGPNHVWTYDFVHDSTSDGRRPKILTIVDEFTRESKAIAVDRRMPAARVIDVLAATFAEGDTPEYLRSDNGSEFIARAVKEWLSQRGTKTRYIDPGSPWQNPFGESFHDKLRAECLDLEDFETVAEAKVLIGRWRKEYSEFRPHSSLRYLTPREYRTSWRERVSLSPASRGGRKRQAFVKRDGT